MVERLAGVELVLFKQLEVELYGSFAGKLAAYERFAS